MLSARIISVSNIFHDIDLHLHSNSNSTIVVYIHIECKRMMKNACKSFSIVLRVIRVQAQNENQ